MVKKVGKISIAKINRQNKDRTKKLVYNEE